MAKRRNSDRKIGSGNGDGSKHTQYPKGKSGNLKGRPRKPRVQTVDLRKLLMEKVSLTRNGKTIKVPFAVAHIERLKEKAAKGDSKADRSMFQLYKIAGLLEPGPNDPDEPLHFTLKIGPTRKTLFGDDYDDPTSSTDNIDKPDDKDEGD
jgi:hypothetical protein